MSQAPVTRNLLVSVCPNCRDPDGWVQPLNDALTRFGLTDLDVAAMFLGQIAHESSELNRLAENLFYTAKRLMQIWPKRFPSLLVANQYALNPEKLANYVYGGRLGNNLPGDGWRYRGRGLNHTTGKANYIIAEVKLDLPLVKHPEMLETKKVAALSAAAFWTPQMALFADDTPTDDQDQDFVTLTRLVNGGTIGLDRRQMYWERAKVALGV